VCNNFFLNRPVYEIMLKTIVVLSRPQMKIRRVRIACWITKAKHMHSKYVILIFFDYNNRYANAPQYYVIRTLLLLNYLIEILRFCESQSILQFIFLSGIVCNFVPLTFGYELFS